MELLNKKLFDFINQANEVSKLIFSYYYYPDNFNFKSIDLIIEFDKINISELLNEIDFVSENSENTLKMLIKAHNRIDKNIFILKKAMEFNATSETSDLKLYFFMILKNIEEKYSSINNYLILIFEEKKENSILDANVKESYQMTIDDANIFTNDGFKIFQFLVDNYKKGIKNKAKFQNLYWYFNSRSTPLFLLSVKMSTYSNYINKKYSIDLKERFTKKDSSKVANELESIDNIRNNYLKE